MRRADNLTTFMCRLSKTLGAWTSWNPQVLSSPVMGLLYLMLANLKCCVVFLSYCACVEILSAQRLSDRTVLCLKAKLDLRCEVLECRQVAQVALRIEMHVWWFTIDCVMHWCSTLHTAAGNPSFIIQGFSFQRLGKLILWFQFSQRRIWSQASSDWHEV
jgi:hypothetical protein